MSETLQHILSHADTDMFNSDDGGVVRLPFNIEIFCAENDAKIQRLTKERDDAMREAGFLATRMWERYYKKDSPVFNLLDSPAGIITQIDNMLCGITEMLNTANSRLEVQRVNIEALQKTSCGIGAVNV